MKHQNIVFLTLILLNCILCDTQKNYKIGGIFDDNPEDEKAFKFSVDMVNSLYQNSLEFAPLTITTEPKSAFKAFTGACSFLDDKSIAIFGPKNIENINIIQSLCDEKDIPHLITRFINNPFGYMNTINFYPNSKILSRAYVDIIEALDWQTFTIFYEDDESLLRLSDLISASKEIGIAVSVKQLDETGDEIYRFAFKQAKNLGEMNFVIDCKLENLNNVLTQAQQIGLMTNEYHFFITNLDLHTIDIEPFQYCGANITSVRLIDPEIIHLKLENFADLISKHEIPPAQEMKTETALLIDAITVFAKATEQAMTMEHFDMQEVLCNTSNSFLFGTTLLNFIKGVEFPGLTGLIKFDNAGFRSVFSLDFLEVTEEGLVKTGLWNSTKGLMINRPSDEELAEDSSSMRNKTFIVITCLTDPYGMLKETSEPLYGNDRYEGFGIDLIYELAQMEGFNYTFIIREDKKNGEQDKITGKWSGMIGDVMEHRADLAITDLTITSEREEAVDFTEPFMNLGISILAREPGNAPPSFFSFADPFAIDTWMMLALAYAVVTVSLFIFGRLCPDEWTNPYPCIEEPEFLINQFSMQNSSWFTIGSLMQQGTEIAPIAISTRMTAGMWWFFVLIMVSSYTANLAAFLTTENPIELFTDVYTLAERSKELNIRMGAKKGGATAGFFKGKDDNPTYKIIAEYMENHPKDMVTDNKDGVKLAENSTYAFFMESTSIEYETQRHCDLQMYGQLLDDKGYGIAMRKNSSYRMRLNKAILKLQSSGQLENIKRKWWEERKGGGQCSGETEAQEATPLNLENVEGVFYVTVGGTICSIICVLLEMFVSTVKLSVKAKIPFKEALRCEIRAYLNFSSNVKPVIGSEKSESRKSESGSTKECTHTVENSVDNADNHLKPEPYGFIKTVSQERLTKDSSS